MLQYLSIMNDLDDLFTDQLNELSSEHIHSQLNAELEISAASATPPPLGLAERLDELRLSGCTQ